MKFLVEEPFLQEYLRMFTRYSKHHSNCDLVSYRGDNTDMCTCGYSQDIKNLQILEKTTVKPFGKKKL
jgi:hypothetical protein